MQAIVFHRRAARYLIRMPRDRAVQVRDSLREVAALANIADHPGIKTIAGKWPGGPVCGWEATAPSCM